VTTPRRAPSWRGVLAVLLLYGVPLLGLLVLVTSARELPLDRWPELLLFAALCALSQLMPVQLFRNSSMSVASAVAFAGLVWLGPAAGVWVSLGGGLVMCFRPRRKTPLKMAFNVGGLAVAAQVAGFLYVATGGVVGHARPDLDMLVPIVVSVAARYFLNTGLVAAAIALTTNSSLRSVWETNFRWLAAIYLGLGLIGFGMAVATDAIGVLGLTIALVPLAIAWYAYRLYVAEAEQARRRSEELQLTSAMLSASPDMMLRLDPTGRILSGNAGDGGVLAVPPEQLVGRNLSDLLPAELVDPAMQHVTRTLESGTMQLFEFQMPTVDGVGEFEARLVVSGEDEVLAIVRDNTARKELERQLAHQAFHDGLTGLPNRVLFMDRLTHALARAARSRSSVAVLFLDLDRFKVINDSLGHDVGDQVLIAVAQHLSGTIRVGDTVARLGGDEFTVLLEDIADPADARAVAERIMSGLQTPFALAGHEVCITTSIGIAVSANGLTPAEDLVRDADAAMYRGKSTGKARYELYDSTMHARALERLQLEAELRHGIERGELRVHYQPKVELATGRIAGVEALVRWQHPDRGLIAPAHFVPLAEETGLILPMGRWVLAEACRQGVIWQERYPERPPLTVSVNLSVRQFQHPSLVDDVARVLRQTGLEPGRLVLEITEGIVMEAAEASSAALLRLKELGVKLAIDDFGTGYSSLSYLKRFPVDMLKIDRSFIDGLGRDPGDAAIVHAVTGLAHTLGLQVTAEGIETAEQLVHLQMAGCDLGQGYYFSRPMPCEAAEELLADGYCALGPRLALVG
jgi:diguanylate cyclase (GGDEF)-like protein/PAS domain S-box-containing protein